MKCLRKMAKYTWQDYRTNEDILSQLKIRPVAEKIQNYRNKWMQHVQQMDSDRQTATLNFEISTMWETKPRMTRQKIFLLVMGKEQAMRSKTLQAM